MTSRTEQDFLPTITLNALEEQFRQIGYDHSGNYVPDNRPGTNTIERATQMSIAIFEDINTWNSGIGELFYSHVQGLFSSTDADLDEMRREYIIGLGLIPNLLRIQNEPVEDFFRALNDLSQREIAQKYNLIAELLKRSRFRSIRPNAMDEAMHIPPFPSTQNDLKDKIYMLANLLGGNPRSDKVRIGAKVMYRALAPVWVSTPTSTMVSIDSIPFALKAAREIVDASLEINPLDGHKS